MPNVRVVPDQLRNGATQVAEVATAWQQAASSVRGAVLAGDDYGLLGRDLVTTYNQTVDQIASDLETGHQRINVAASALAAVATGFENVDDCYYRKFGYRNR
jgi:hypothetical protein